MKAIHLIFLFSLSVIMCKPAGNQEAIITEDTETSPEEYVSSSAAVEDNKDTAHKFIRTAEMKFRVKNVFKSTIDIENITGRQGGFVTYTSLTSNVDHFASTAVSADSAIETTYFTVTNSIILRVPNTKLDTTLREIARNIVYLDYRIIKAEDVALQILSNKLTQERAEKSENRINEAIDSRGKKLVETTEAEKLLQNKEEQSDKAMIYNLELADQVNFSTVNLTIYQGQESIHEMVSNKKPLKEYRPGLAKRTLESLKFGWRILEEIFVFIVKLWALILLAIVIYILYRQYWNKIIK